jgi:hypothetical protein
MKAQIRMRNATSFTFQTKVHDDLLDREIDRAVRDFLMQSPPPRVYSAVSLRIRELPSAPRERQLPIVAVCAIAVGILLVVAALGALGPRAIEMNPVAPGRGVMVLMWMSNTDVARWVNESESIFAYPGILFLHTLGLATVVGLSLAIDIRLLGMVRRIPAASLRRLFPYIWLGFFINAASGFLLFIADIRKAFNPLFDMKLALVALGVISMTLIHRELFQSAAQIDLDEGPSARRKFLGYASIVIWVAAIAAGRLLAYVHGS